jgi:TonB family protein
VRNMLTVAAFSVLLAGPALAQTGEVYKPGNGVTSPVIVREVKPTYTKAAMDRKVQGTVEVTAVILADGTVGDVTMKRSLDPDLDVEAIRATKQWKFKPGTKDGTPVPVEVSIELSFTLRDGPTYTVDAGVISPVVTKEVKPKYTEGAIRRRVQGSVGIEAVVLKDGTVGNVRVTRSLDEELDQEAVAAAKQWTFKPGTKDGKPVNVQVNIELTFTLRDKR